MRPGTYKLDWQETQSRASTGLEAGSSYCQSSWPFLPGLGQPLLFAEQPHSPACGSHLHLQEPTISHGLILQLERVSVHPHWDLYGGRGWLPPALSVLTSSPCLLCSTSHERAHTHTHTCTCPPPQRFWRRDQAEARWRRGGHGRAGITQCPALTLPPTGDRQSAAEARLPSGVVTCVLCAGDREKGERDRLAASGPCACACLGTEVSAQPRGGPG